ncbi:hypothetical protein L195_g019454 [Trifolium pratense]|uniref:Uncharacterized protein n=1 Tax=Trifolium pratense TaxID=57577 RepID=A0A2K3MZQ4_TRIPR|nr:hypothetical protein L195_g019454 [Trifolium pratense]
MNASSRVSLQAPKRLPIDEKWRKMEFKAEELYYALKKIRHAGKEDFEAEFYEGKDKIYFSTCWYQRYAPHIGETVVIKDEKGNKFIAFLVDDSKFEMKVLGHYLGKIDTNDPAKYDGHWGYDPMWVLEISEEMSTEGKLLMIPDDVVDIIYHGSVDYELEVSVSETNECYTWEVQHMVAGWY